MNVSLLFTIGLAAAGLLLMPATAGAQVRDIAVFSQSVPLDPKARGRDRVGQLIYRGGIALRSTERRFGGYSGLHVAADGKYLLAVSDKGTWLRLSLRYGQGGQLTGAADGRMGPLIGRDGKRLRGRGRDAEALAVMPDGSMIVAFERRHRIRVYPPAAVPFSVAPRAYPLPAGAEDASGNGGLETLVHVGRGYLLTLSERQRAGPGLIRGWVGVDGGWLPLSWRRLPGFRPTDAALMPNGDVLVLERRFFLTQGATIRFMQVPRRGIGPRRTLRAREIARLTPGMTVDNFEGISVRQGDRGETLIYVISDNNFSPLQRTLLLMFELSGSASR